MRFSYAKKDLICKHCKETIRRGGFCVRTFYSNKSGFKAILCYHLECYLRAYEERFNKSFLYWIEQQIPPKKLGRPKKSSNPRDYNRLKALFRYHRNLGHTTRAEEVQEEIKKLEGMCSI